MSRPRRLDIEAAIELPRTLTVARTSGDSRFPPASRGPESAGRRLM